MNEKELLDSILEKYHNRDKWDKRSLSEMIDDELSKYNESVKKDIEAELYAILGSMYFSNTNGLIAITPVSLSEKLYNNAKDVSKQATQILYENINAKTPIKQLAMKLYEGYDFNEKEILDIKKKLPKYLQDDIKQKSKTFIKDVEKLKTKPLRIAYKKIYTKLDTMNKEAFNNAVKVAIEEKSRYYANRIAQTETHRARTSKRAMEYLEDDEVKFVKYRMSSKHKITDICDFYANLDLGYGKGIIPKKEMRTLPLHPHCHCVYDPYYEDVKGKQKEWKSAVNDTMKQFSEYDRRQIVGSKSKLMEFKKGEDIETLFNRIRPKYPIRRYVDIFNGKLYNKNMEKIEKRFLEKVSEFDENNPIESFKKLWVNEKVYKVHIKKRVKQEVIKDEKEYLIRTFKTLLDYDLVLEFKNLNKDGWNRIHYNKKDEWAVIIGENGDILTSYKKTEEIEETIKKNEERNLKLQKKEEIKDETKLKREIKSILDRLR